jgi:hypothetical protein
VLSNKHYYVSYAMLRKGVNDQIKKCSNVSEQKEKEKKRQKHLASCHTPLDLSKERKDMISL